MFFYCEPNIFFMLRKYDKIGLPYSSFNLECPYNFLRTFFSVIVNEPYNTWPI